MILDLERFAGRERRYWQELEGLLLRFEPGHRPLELEEWDRFQQLYSRAGWALTRVQNGASATDLERYLTQLVARAYGELYQSRERMQAKDVLRGAGRLAVLFPQVFRKHIRLFALSVAITLAGAVVAGVAVSVDPVAVNILLPAGYLQHPGKRVAQEEHHPSPLLNPRTESAFAAGLMTHNIRVTLLVLFLGVTLGFGTAAMLFMNGALLGAVVARYGLAGFGAFAASWLLPHGAFEIPAMLIGGQGGFLIAAGLLQRGRESRSQRLRALLPDLTVIIGGLACMLVWAGVIEGFYSQHHGPGLEPYQIAFGLSELAALTLYFSLAGRKGKPPAGAAIAPAAGVEARR